MWARQDPDISTKQTLQHEDPLREEMVADTDVQPARVGSIW